MSSYLLSVVGTVLISSVLVAILPSGKTAELIKAIVRTACLVVILSPVAKLFVDSKNNSGIFVESSIELHQDFIEYSCKRRVEETEAQLKNELDGWFGGILSVELDWEMDSIEVGAYSTEEIRVQKIVVWTESSYSEEKKQQIGDYLRNSYGCESVVGWVE